jgi:hypothetical protein
MRLFTVIFVLCMMSLNAAAQVVVFEREGVEYRLDLPSSRWRAVPRVDVHEHFDFVNGENRADGYLRVRKSLVEVGTTPKDLYLGDEARTLKFLPGFVRCATCEGEPFSGALSGAVFSYEFTSAGRPVAGRVYYLQVDARTFYVLHFTCYRDKLTDLRLQADSIARSFRMK